MGGRLYAVASETRYRHPRAGDRDKLVALIAPPFPREQKFPCDTISEIDSRRFCERRFSAIDLDRRSRERKSDRAK